MWTWRDCEACEGEGILWCMCPECEGASDHDRLCRQCHGYGIHPEQVTGIYALGVDSADRYRTRQQVWEMISLSG